jgi:hypothetical protein
MGKYKDETGKTRIGSFLQKAAPHVLDVAANLTGLDALGAISDAILNDDKLTDGQKVQAQHMIALDMEDIKNARDMQKAALMQNDLFSKRFVYYLASFVMFVLAALLIMLFWVEIPEGNGEIIYMAIGMFLGIASSVAAFFFGSSAGSKEKQAGIDKMIGSIKK